MRFSRLGAFWPFAAGGGHAGLSAGRGVGTDVVHPSHPPPKGRRRGSGPDNSPRTGDHTHAFSKTRRPALLLLAAGMLASRPAAVWAQTTLKQREPRGRSRRRCRRRAADQGFQRSRRTTDARADRLRPGHPRPQGHRPQQAPQGLVEPAGAGDSRPPGDADRRDAPFGRAAAGPLRLLLSREQGHRAGRPGGRLGPRCVRPRGGDYQRAAGAAIAGPGRRAEGLPAQRQGDSHDRLLDRSDAGRAGRHAAVRPRRPPGRAAQR